MQYITPMGIRQPEYSLSIRQVVKVFNSTPMLMTKVSIGGGRFPHFDAPEFVRFTNSTGTVDAFFTEISADQKTLSGYFPVTATVSGEISFGYGTHVWGTFDSARHGDIALLEKEKLSRAVVPLTHAWIESHLEMNRKK